jgi:di/tricarboxylate transporter
VNLTDHRLRSVVARWIPAALLAITVAALALEREKHLAQAAILVGFAIVSWALGVFAEPLTTLLFFLLTVIFHVVKPETIFSGFASSAWWLVFGGSITAIAVNSSGLGGRVAQLLSRQVRGSYRRAVAAVALGAVVLSFLMPSTLGRVLLLMPIVLALAGRLGLAPGRPGHAGLVVTVAAASYMPSTTILPANVPNSVLLGAAESIYGIKLTYGRYLLLHFPILGALKTVALIWLVCRLFPERDPLSPASASETGPLSSRERRLAVVLTLSLILFATDFIHGISPAWVALGTGLVCLLPGVGLVTADEFSEQLNVATLLYIAGMLGLGALVAGSGLSRVVSAHLMRIFPLAPGHTLSNLAVLSTMGAAVAALTTVSGVPAVLTPLAVDFAAATGLQLLTVLMLQVVVFSTVFLPFESPPMMVALQLGNVSALAGAKLCLALAAVTIVVLLPLDYFWWRLLGYLP